MFLKKTKIMLFLITCYSCSQVEKKTYVDWQGEIQLSDGNGKQVNVLYSTFVDSMKIGLFNKIVTECNKQCENTCKHSGSYVPREFSIENYADGGYSITCEYMAANAYGAADKVRSILIFNESGEFKTIVTP